MSFHYLVSKIREKGWGYVLRRSMGFLILDSLSILLLPVFYFFNIKFTNFAFYAVGHMGHDPDCFVKEALLGLRPKFNALWLVHRKNLKIANPHFLGYWERSIEGMTVISSPLICNLLWPLTESHKLKYDVDKYSSSSRRHAVASDIYKAWGNRPPVLTLSEYDRKRGWENLRRLGMPEDAWFVTVHCRESGYDKTLRSLGRKNHHETKSQGNADILNHIPAMKVIVERGGWCIRVGDPSMKPLPKLEKVIDYVHTKEKSDWMDVFLLASSKFHLGHSGVFSIAMAFGVPVAFANSYYGPLTFGRPCDIAIPKLIYSENEKKLMTFKEIYNSGIADCYYKSQYEEHDISLIDNVPEDIVDISLEMFEREKGEIVYTDKDEELQEKFRSLMKPNNYGFGGPARIGREFLRKYENLLD